MSWTPNTGNYSIESLKENISATRRGMVSGLIRPMSDNAAELNIWELVHSCWMAVHPWIRDETTKDGLAKKLLAELERKVHVEDNPAHREWAENALKEIRILIQ